MTTRRRAPPPPPDPRPRPSASTTVADPVCANEPDSWCDRFYQWTDNDFLARSADTIVDKTFTITADRPAGAGRPLPAA